MAIAADRALLLGGFEDSSVRLWTLTGRKLKAEDHAVDVSRIHVAGDYVDGQLAEDK